MKRLRHILYLAHRYFGLAMALFLTIAALTGSVLAFRERIERFVAPQLYAKPRPGVPHLSLITLGERAQQQVPHGTVFSVTISRPDQAGIGFRPKTNPATGKPYNLGFSAFYVDPWTGNELAHRTRNDISEGLINLMPWILQIHDKLLVRGWGTTFVGIVALLWLIDCFVALYLTMPPVLRGFLQHWKTSWRIKSNAGPYRLNLDLHRAFGLWLWPILFVFALSSVMYNLRFELWDPVTTKLFGARSIYAEVADLRLARRDAKPLRAFDWNHAIAEGHRLLAEIGAREGFMLGEPRSVSYDSSLKAYSYSEGFGAGGEFAGSVTFVPETGEVLRYVSPYPSSERTSFFIERWLRKLHTADTLGPLYQTFVFFLGLVITMFSVTGIYLWWKKSFVRRNRKPASAESLRDHAEIAQAS